MKIFKNHWPVALVVIALCAARPVAQASIWVETSDAGDLPATAQQTIGAGSLDAIVGTLPIIDDIDMFLIRIPNLSLFSATTVKPPAATEFIDTQLLLFDTSGRGVAANGDADLAGSEANSTIPAGSVAGAAGLYYLAVSEFNDFPVSSSGAIFPDLFFSSSQGEVVGPTGPGGADPISGWDVDGFSESQFEPFPTNYEIVLTGAEAAAVPEVSGFLIWIGIGLSFMGISYGRRYADKACGVLIDASDHVLGN